jgi:hypothetical protein
MIILDEHDAMSATSDATELAVWDIGTYVQNETLKSICHEIHADVFEFLDARIWGAVELTYAALRIEDITD